MIAADRIRLSSRYAKQLSVLTITRNSLHPAGGKMALPTAAWSPHMQKTESPHEAAHYLKSISCSDRSPCANTRFVNMSDTDRDYLAASAVISVFSIAHCHWFHMSPWYR